MRSGQALAAGTPGCTHARAHHARAARRRSRAAAPDGPHPRRESLRAWRVPWDACCWDRVRLG